MFLSIENIDDIREKRVNAIGSHITMCKSWNGCFASWIHLNNYTQSYVSCFCYQNTIHQILSIHYKNSMTAIMHLTHWGHYNNQSITPTILSFWQPQVICRSLWNTLSLHWLLKRHKDPYKQTFTVESAWWSPKHSFTKLTNILMVVKECLHSYRRKNSKTFYITSTFHYSL